MLHYTLSGEGAPLVLIHGLFGASDNLKQLGKYLSSHFNVVAIDARNHGHSPKKEGMHYRDLANDVFAVLDELNFDKAYFVGHSMGGKIAMSAALENPSRVHALCVLDIAPVAYESRHDSIFKGLNAVNDSLDTINTRKDADTILSDSITELGVRQFLLKSLVKGEQSFSFLFDVKGLQRDYASILDWPFESQSYQGKVLFIKGANSDYILPAHKEAITRFFPSARAKIIAGVGHWLHAEKPETVNKSVLDFLLQQ